MPADAGPLETSTPDVLIVMADAGPPSQTSVCVIPTHGQQPPDTRVPLSSGRVSWACSDSSGAVCADTGTCLSGYTCYVSFVDASGALTGRLQGYCALP
jgi:hypothetical protein